MWHRSVPLRRDGVAEPGWFPEPRVRLRLPRTPRELSRQHRPGPAPPSTPANREPQLRDQRRGDLEALDSFLRTGRCRALLPSSATAHEGTAQSCARGGLHWALGSLCLARGWSNTGTGFLERWSMLQACQCFRRVWTTPLTTCLNFRSALNGPGSWTG